MLEASMNNQGEVEDEELIENVTSVTYAGIFCSFLAYHDHSNVYLLA